jgi:RNA polymerase-binding protein DksA
VIQPLDDRLPDPDSPLAPEQLDRFRDLLLEERRKALDSLIRLQRDAVQDSPENVGDTPIRTHLADLGSETFEQEENFGLAEQFSRALTAVDHALNRLDQGAYGICEACGLPIPVERLEAIPAATRCAVCQAREERELDES